MTRPISTRVHGIIDYTYAATLVALPLIFRWDRRAMQLSAGVALATLGISLMTKYEYGAVPLLPMKAHLAMDAAETSMLMGAKKMLGSGNRAATILTVLGAIGAAVGAMTQTESPLEISERLALPASGV